MAFRLHFPHLAPTDQAEFMPDPKWTELRDQYAAQYPVWQSRANDSFQKLAQKLRKAWIYHQARILNYLRAVAVASNVVERLPAALEAYKAAGGQHIEQYQQNTQELTYRVYLLSSFVLAESVRVADRPDAKFVLWRKVALTTRGAAFGSAMLGHAVKLQRDAEGQIADLQNRTKTMQKGLAAGQSTPRRGVRS